MPRRYGKNVKEWIKRAKADKEATAYWTHDERNAISNLIWKDKENRNILEPMVIHVCGSTVTWRKLSDIRC